MLAVTTRARPATATSVSTEMSTCLPTGAVPEVTTPHPGEATPAARAGHRTSRVAVTWTNGRLPLVHPRGSPRPGFARAASRQREAVEGTMSLYRAAPLLLVLLRGRTKVVWRSRDRAAAHAHRPTSDGGMATRKPSRHPLRHWAARRLPDCLAARAGQDAGGTSRACGRCSLLGAHGLPHPGHLLPPRAATRSVTRTLRRIPLPVDDNTAPPSRRSIGSPKIARRRGHGKCAGGRDTNGTPRESSDFLSCAPGALSKAVAPSAADTSRYHH